MMKLYNVTAAILILLITPTIAVSSEKPTYAVDKVMNAFHKAASESDYQAYFSKFSPNEIADNVAAESMAIMGLNGKMH
jgi:hypothetical protein